jgi:hypothetical protein
MRWEENEAEMADEMAAFEDKDSEVATFDCNNRIKQEFGKREGKSEEFKKLNLEQAGQLEQEHKYEDCERGLITQRQHPDAGVERPLRVQKATGRVSSVEHYGEKKRDVNLMTMRPDIYVTSLESQEQLSRHRQRSFDRSFISRITRHGDGGFKSRPSNRSKSAPAGKVINLNRFMVFNLCVWILRAT